MDLLQGLNPPQCEAVMHVDGPLLILAGAGSGKTRVITHRIAHLVRTRHIPASAVLAVTFTNKAAEEMRNRVRALLDGVAAPSELNLSTFHSFCVRLLRRDGDGLAQVRPGFTRRFNIYDDDDQIALIKTAYRHLGLDDTFMKARAMLSIVSNAKNQRQTPDEMHRSAKDPRMAKAAVVYDEYEKGLRNANALDFDDLLLETVRLLRVDEATRERYNRRLSYLMIDEYQDTNRTQYDLIRLLSTGHDNVCVVGDEDQSIYSWRGADIRNILDFERDYRNALVIRLEQNYRSTKTILAAAGAVVANNTERKGKTLWTDAGAGENVSLYAGFDAENEALFIADTIDGILRKDPGEHIAILYRTNSQSRQIEEALRRYGRNYKVVGGFSFYQRSEIKDILSYLKVAASPQDSISLLRIINTPARGIGKTTVEQIERYALTKELSVWSAVEQMVDEQQFAARAHAALAAFRSLIRDLAAMAAERPPHELIKHLLERSGYRRMLEQENTDESRGRVENLDEMLNAALEASERGETLSDFLDHAALVADADQVDERIQVNLLTLHNAKGLEFPIVFLAGMEEGLFPHVRSLDSNALLEEERRLCYVGMTRAEKKLYLTWARYRRRFGGGEQERSIRSRFIKEVPPHLVAEVNPSEPTVAQVDLTAERHQVRESVRRNLYTGKTYNSLENISQFFTDRGKSFAAPGNAAAEKPAAAASFSPKPPAAAASTAAPAKKAGTRPGNVINHPKYGRGTIVRREGDGEDAKLTVSFPGHGLKKLIAKYAGLKNE
ncbi:MAG: ATP-dependent helicase [Bryobacteraceae bacterium]